MWTPTHVQVTVHRARNLLPKGKGGTNDAYVTIQLGREKYQTSVRDKTDTPEWHEECDLPVPNSDGIIHLNVYHRSFLGLDDFLGHLALPLSQFQVYERPRSRWYALRCKPGKKSDSKYRGEIEVKVTFIVQSKSSSQQSLNKKIRRAGSIKSLASSMGDKLKLPVRSNSFKSDRKLEEKKPPAAIIQPLVSSPCIHPKVSNNLTPSGQTDIAQTSVHVESPEKPPAEEAGHGKPANVDSNSNQTKPPEASAPAEMGIIPQPKPPIIAPKPLSMTSKPNVVANRPARRAFAMDPDGVSALPDRPKMHALSMMRQLSQSDIDLRSDKAKDAFVRSQPGFRVPVLKRTQSDADARFVQPSSNGGGTEMSETPLLDTREMTRSLGKLPDESDCIFTTGEWSPGARQAGLNTLADKYRSSLGSSIPESIPEDNETLSQSADETKLRSPRDRENLRKIRDTSRRHTLQGGMNELPKMPTHQLHEGFSATPRLSAGSIPPEILEKYADMNREVLICLAESQQNQLHAQNAYIRDLENYIDNLLVRVMEAPPRLLQNPYDTPYNNRFGTGHTQPSQQLINKKKPLANPFRRLQKALK